VNATSRNAIQDERSANESQEDLGER
jgi:hypothetical protein